MWRQKINGVLGIWIIVLAFLGFSESLKRVLFILTGVLIAVFAFKGKQFVKPTEELKKEAEEEEIKKTEEENKLE